MTAALPISAAPIVLEARQVRRRFSGLVAVDGVDLVLREGEAVGLIGANGAGKTTLFNCLSGFDRPTEGEVCFRGRPLRRMRRHQVVRAGLARTFQIVRPFADLPVLAHVLVPQIVAGRGGETRDEGLAVLARVGLSARADDPAAQLSEGDLKRLEMARALATRPRVLLLDEPFAGLSPAEIAALSSTIQELRADGLSMLIVEHKIGALLPLVTRVVAMDQGRVVAAGDPEDVLRDPAVVQAYFGGDEA